MTFAALARISSLPKNNSNRQYTDDLATAGLRDRGPAVTAFKKEMFMNEKIAILLNEQINKEFYSAYLYLDIANY